MRRAWLGRSRLGWFFYNRRHRMSGPQRWLAPVCWVIGHDEGTNGQVCWCRRCGIRTWEAGQYADGVVLGRPED